MRNILIGIMDSNVGGVNRFIIDYILQHKDNKYIILSNSQINKIYLEELKDYTIKIVPSVVKPVKLFCVSCEIIKENKIDEVYLNVSTNLFYPVLKAAYNCGVEHRIVHSHSSYSAEGTFIKRCIIVFINNLLKNKVKNKSTVRKACSDKAANWLFGPNSDYEFVYNKVSKSRFLFSPAVRNEYRLKYNLEDKIVVGFVGGFNYPKNVFYFLKLAKEIKKNMQNFCIVMIGDGNLKGVFEKKIKKLRLDNYFILLGNKGNINDFYNMFDCFVMPSRFEGLPIVGIEAQVNGLKCFFSDKITKKVIITDEAEIFCLKNLAMLAKSIIKIQSDTHNITPKMEFNNFLTK